jgi:hypothetical protein
LQHLFCPADGLAYVGHGWDSARSNNIPNHLIHLPILDARQDMPSERITQHARQRLLPLPDLPDPP